MLKPVTTITVVVALVLLAALVTAQSSSDVPADPSDTGYLNLHKRHPDGLEGREDFDRLTPVEALGRLEQMRGFLVSFRRLTDEVRPRMNQAELKAIGNTDREMQSLGFHNIPLIVEGVILKQAYQLAQARYELARLKSERGAVRAEDVARATSDYRAAAAALQTFWDTKLPSD